MGGEFVVQGGQGIKGGASAHTARVEGSRMEATRVALGNAPRTPDRLASGSTEAWNLHDTNVALQAA